MKRLIGPLVVVGLLTGLVLLFTGSGSNRSVPKSASANAASDVPADKPDSIQAEAASFDPTAPTTGSVSAKAVGTNALTTSWAASLAARRVWDAAFLDSFQHQSERGAIQFELTSGVMAAGTIRKIERREGRVIGVMGELTVPERGSYFFQRQTEPGLQGEFAGLVTFPASQVAFRIEPIEPAATSGKSELVKRRLDEVMCLLPEARGVAAETEEIPPLDPSDHPDYPIPDYQDGIIPLQSLPGATAVLYIDYRGGYNDNNWGSFPYARPNVSNAQIKDVWKRVAEDYQPFRINVTTDLKVYEAAPESSRQRCVVTPTTTAAPGAGGVAWLNSWNWTGDVPCWAFYSTGKSAAEVISHEVGHTLTLSHDGTSTEGYYGGQGSGAVGWAPIMGVGYYQPVSQWSKGEYTDANNTEDDLARIDNNNNSVDYRADDSGATLTAARYLEAYPGNTVSAEGVIERTEDTDAFQFTTTGGAVSLRADPAPGVWANLALAATLADASNIVIASNNVQTQLWASLSANLPAGTYTFRVTGTGRNNPLTDGFSSYASLGYYSITGTVAGVRLPSRFTVAENSPAGTVVGTVTAANLGVDALGYSIVAGNSNGVFALNNSGVLTVANTAPLNYEALAQNTQLAVQFELLVNITNYSNPALSETGRRVVVQLLDVNEPPVATGFTNWILTGMSAGAMLGKVAATDPDYYTILNFSILSGNTNGLFAIGAQSGTVTLTRALTPGDAGIYTLTVRVADTGPVVASNSATIRFNVIANQTPFTPGAIHYAVYDGIGSGNLVEDLTNNARFPTDPTWEQARTLFEGDSNRADDYGSVMRGYLIPPMSGTYTFFIATDDNGELWISPSTNPAAMTLAASISGSGNWAAPRQWNKFASQTSAPRTLVAGQGYYIEARQKEGGGGDNLAVAWRGPATTNQTNVISGLYLAPYPMNYLPKATGFTQSVRRDALPGSRLGRLTVTDANPNDTHTFTILSGNTENIFGVDAAGYITVADTTALATTAESSFTLSVRATDSGMPSLSATGTVVLNIVEAEVITTTTLRRELFYDLGSSTAVSALTGSAKFPSRPDALGSLTDFASPTDVADNYGSRIRACVVPSVSGSYRFFIASDDDSQLKFSLSTNPAAATVIASVSGWTGAGQWNKYASQASSPVNLVAGQPYYVEVLQKEGGGGDHVSVGWEVPNSGATNTIPAANLLPVDINAAPELPAQVLTVLPGIVNGTQFGTVTATDSPLDSLTYELVAGNVNDTFAIEPATGRLLVQDNTLINSGAVTNFNLTVRVQDSGYGGLYPLRTTSGSVTVSVGSTNQPFVWTGLAGTNRWSAAGNWGGGVPLPGARVLFGQPNQQSNVNDVATSLAWVQFTNGGFTCTGAPVTLQSGLTNTGANVWGISTTLGAAQTWLHSGGGEFHLSAPLTNNGFTPVLVANADLRISGPIIGTGGLNKSGTGRLFMQGTHPYTGTTLIASAGTTAALEVNGAEDLNLMGSSVIMNGRMDLWNHSATIGALSGNGLIYANDGNRTLTLGGNNASGSFAGLIQDRSWASGVTLRVVKTGTGAQTFSTTNTYSGGLVVDQGTVIISAPTTGSYAGHGASNNTITVGAGAQLSYAVTRAAGFHTGPVALLPGAKMTFAGTDNNLACGNTLTLTSATIQGGGQLRIRGANASSPRYVVGAGAGASIISVGTLTLTGDGGMTNVVFDVADGTASPDLQISSTISGQFGNANEGITKLGQGSMALNGNCTYVGPTIVEAGTLLVNGALGTNSLTVQAGATLGGSGLINGNTWVQPGGLLAPGVAGTGKLTFSRNLTLNGTAAMELSTDGAITNDLVMSTAAVNYGGTLTVTHLGGAPLMAGNSFKLFQAATYNGQFTATNLPSLPAGLVWQWTPANGTLIVTALVNPEPPSLMAFLAGGQITLEWPADRTGWTLQVQTNGLATGLAGEWHDVPGSTATNQLTFPNDPANPTVFYRLTYP